MKYRDLDDTSLAVILDKCSNTKGQRCSECPAFGKGDYRCSTHAMKEASKRLMNNYVHYDKWISMKDKLPDKDGIYLVLYDEPDFPYSFCVQVRRFFKNDHDAITWRKVTHWMPLPEPPEVKEHE